MEILRFEESDAPAPKKKRPSKGLLALGLVAALMGIGTAFASSTISINGDNTDNSDGVQQITCSDLEFNKVSIEGTGPDAAAHCSVTDGSVYFAVSDHTSYMMKFNLSNINADKFAYITVEAGNYFDPVASPLWGYPV